MSHRRTILGGLSAAAASLLLPRSVLAAAPGVSEKDWMLALLRELHLQRPGEKELDPAELVKRLGTPSRIDLDAASMVLRTASIRDEKHTITGSAPERWLATLSDQPGAVVFRTQIQRPGRHLIRLRSRGGPHLVSFGASETRTIDNPAEVRDDSVQDLEGVALTPGWVDIAVSLSPGGAVERLVVHPEAGSPLSPPRGWSPQQTLTVGAKAAVLVRLGRWEGELPASEGGPRNLPIMGGYDHQGRSLRKIRIEEAGVYTLAVRVAGSPPARVFLDDMQLFLTPGIAGIKTSPGLGTLATLGTMALTADDHDLTFEGAAGAIYDLLFLRRSATEFSYLTVARAHGLELGPLASAKASAPVDTTTLNLNVAALRSLLIGALPASATRSRASKAVPPPPSRPAPVSPVFP